MISKEEVMSLAAAKQLQAMVVEKDYALGWLLHGISRHPELSNIWIFKGGTCLKKCYFETYRFSEDLDFSAIEPSRVPDESTLNAIFRDIAGSLYSETGLEFPVNGIEFEVFQNKRGTTSIQGKLSYRGPVRPQVNIKNLPRIKLDVTYDERVLLGPVRRPVDHPYSDNPPTGISVLAYAYEEVFAEKTRALVQRLRPRDLYDVIHLYRNKAIECSRSRLKDALEQKFKVRGVTFPPTMEVIATHESRQFLESEWDNQLRHQVPILPPFEHFLTALPEALTWILNGEESQLPPAPGTTASNDERQTILDKDQTRFVIHNAGGTYLEKIRYAASNRLLIQLGYGGTVRIIEPYAFVRSTDGNLLLRSIKRDTREPRQYRIDRIQSLIVKLETFQPTYQIEITPSGPLPVRQIISSDRSSIEGSLAMARGGLKYVHKCPVCKKEFRRISSDTSLRAHKNKRGHPCPGRIGIFVKMDQ